MADREYLTGNLEFAGAELPRSAKPALSLSRFKDSPVELRLLAAQYGQLFFERADFFRPFMRTRIHFLICLITSELGPWRQLFWVSPLPHLTHVQRSSIRQKTNRRICNQCHARLGNSEAPRGLALVFDECARCGYPPCGSSESSRIPRPRPTSDTGSASVLNDTENVREVQILFLTIPLGCRRGQPDSSGG